MFSLIVLALCLLVPLVCAKLAGLDLGYAVGLYAGSQTISASIGVASDQITRLGLPAEQAQAYLDAIPIGYAVTYIFGTIGSAIVLAQIGPKLIGVDLPAACAEYEKQMGGGQAGLDPGVFSTYRRVEVRAYRIDTVSGLTGKPVRELFPGLRIFVERIRRGTEILEADAGSVLQHGDIVSISGPREALVEQVEALVPEVDDKSLLDMPATLVDVFVRSKAVNGLTLREIADLPETRGIYLRKITRNMIEIPVLPETEVLRGDILTIAGSTRHVDQAVALLGHADRPVESTDLAVVSAGIVIGGLLGALTYVWGGIPISLSTSGGALLAGLVLGYLRTIHPTFGNIPGPALWLMNTLGLNVFIAIVGISAGPGIRVRPAAGRPEPVPVGHGRDDDPAGRGRAARPLRLQVPPRDPVRRLRRRAHDDGRARHDPGGGEEQGAGARLRDALRHRQYAADHLRHGDRADAGRRILIRPRPRPPRRSTWTL